MTERLACYDGCVFRGTNLIRPCAREVYNHNQACIINIQTDKTLEKFEGSSAYASMDGLINHQVEVTVGKKVVGIVERGVVTNLS